MHILMVIYRWQAEAIWTGANKGKQGRKQWKEASPQFSFNSPQFLDIRWNFTIPSLFARTAFGREQGLDKRRNRRLWGFSQVFFSLLAPLRSALHHESLPAHRIIIPRKKKKCTGGIPSWSFFSIWRICYVFRLFGIGVHCGMDGSLLFYVRTI